MSSLRRLAAVLAVLVVPPLVTLAEEGAGSSATPGSKPAASKPSSQAVSLSRALVPRQTWDQLLDRSAKGLSDAVSRSLETKGEAVPEGLEGKLREELGQSLQYDSAVDNQAQALERRFSRGEMEAAARFYTSPVGKKMLERLPEAQSEVSDRLQEQLAVVVPDIVHRVAPALESGQGGGGAEPDQGIGAGTDP